MLTIGKSLIVLLMIELLIATSQTLAASTAIQPQKNDTSNATNFNNNNDDDNASNKRLAVADRIQSNGKPSIVNLYRSGETETEPKVDVKAIEKCTNILEKNDLINKCVALVNSNWGCLIEAKNGEENQKLHQISLTCGTNEPMICCPLWAIIRCILKQAQINCNDNLVNDYRKYNFQQLIYQLDSSRCRNYTFGSEECIDVFKFVTNQELLEKDAKEKGLYRYFFKFGQSNDTSLPIFSREKESNAVAISGHIGLIFGLLLFTLVLCNNNPD